MAHAAVLGVFERFGLRRRRLLTVERSTRRGRLPDDLGKEATTSKSPGNNNNTSTAKRSKQQTKAKTKQTNDNQPLLWPVNDKPVMLFAAVLSTR